MRKIKYMVAAAIVTQSLAFAATPAFAGVVDTQTVGGPIQPTSAAMVTECTKVLAGHPAAARFYATASFTGYTEVVNAPVESTHLFETIGNGGELTGLQLDGPFKNSGAVASASTVASRVAPASNGGGNNGGGNGGGGNTGGGNGGGNAGNGGNYNLFAQNFFTEVTVSQVKETWNVAVTTDYTAVFHCDIRNKTGNLAGAEWQVYNKSLAAGSQTVTTFYEDITGGGTEALETPVANGDAYLICNRANGEWSAKNGYAGEFGDCSDELFDATTELLNEI